MRLQGLWAPQSLIHFATRRNYRSDVRPFSPGDLVLLRQTLDRTASPILTRPLKPGRRIESHKGIIQHDDIIGRCVRDTVSSTNTKSGRAGTQFRLHSVTLEEYVRLTKRLVTPIYPADANLIVSLLDLHPESPYVENDATRQLHILEAGTGHGALTLHLSRAVHAANAARETSEVDYDNEVWRRQRKAIIHTADVSPKFSSHAQDVVRGFRQGLYARNVDFHVGDVSDIVHRLQVEHGSSIFLSHAFLDLPAADTHIATVANALHTDGTVIVFNPSITQITECATLIKDERIPLDLDKVVELGVNASSGGREWDVRFVRPRSVEPAAAAESAERDSGEAHKSEDAVAQSETEDRLPALSHDGKWSMVCRPKVGDRIVGGGFLGVWKKHRHADQSGSK